MLHLCYRTIGAVLQVLTRNSSPSPRSRPKRRAQLLEKATVFYNGRRRQPSFKPSAVFIDRLEEPGDDIRLLYAVSRWRDARSRPTCIERISLTRSANRRRR